MNKFEQLIEFVINDDESKARELFHEIVVEKSREIYENLMNEESEEDLDEAKEEDEGEELDESAKEDEEELDEGLSAPDADSADNLIDDVEAEEEGIEMQEDEEDFEGEEEVEFGGEEEGGEDLEDRVVDLEDKLDELMAEFEALMGSESGEEHQDLDVDAGGDALEMDDTEEFTDEAIGSFMENVDLKAAPAPVKSEEGGINTKSTVAANAGAKGPVGSTVKPVSASTSEEKGRTAPGTKELIGKVGNSPAQSGQKLAPATKPTTAQASGVNTKSPVAKA